MNSLIDAAVDHARTVLLLLVFLLVAGIVTYLQIPKEADPDVDIPVLHVNVTLDGISPEDSDRMLVRPLEKALEGIDGVRKVQSVAYEGGAEVTLEFGAGFDSDTATNDVRETVAGVRNELPDDAEEPEVVEIKLSQFPQLVIGLAGAVPERALYALSEELKEALEAVPGVLSVAVNGKREEMVEILVDPLTLESYNIGQADLVNAVARNNELVAAGILDNGVGRFALKVPGVIESAEELLALPIKALQGQVVRMQDIAEVRRVYKDADSIARIGGHRSVTLEVIKRNGANVIETINQVRQVVAQQRTRWPAALEVNYFGDRSIEIRDVLGDLQNNILSAIFLVVVVVIASLGFRSAMFVAVAIPGSFVIGILVVDMLGLTVNIVVLFALIMAVGMLVDGAIVVTEYADRLMLSNVPRKDAYKRAARRMAWPIIAATATTLAAFVPLLFWPGVIGEFMKYLPITLLTTLTASLAMALIFVPTMGGLMGRTRQMSSGQYRNLISAETGELSGVTGLAGVYVRFLRWCLRFPGSMLLLIIGLLLMVVAAYSRFGSGTEFFPDVEPRQSIVTVLARGDLSVRERDEILSSVENEILKIEEIDTVYAQTQLNDNDGIASLTLEFKEWNRRERRVDEVLDQIRGLQDKLPGVRLEIQKLNAGPGGDRKPIQVAFSASDPDVARSALLEAREWMVQQGGYTDIEDSLPLPGMEWHINVDREAAGRFGADVNLIGTFVQLVTNGVQLSTYRPDDSHEELDIRVRFTPEYRQLSQLQNMRVATVNGYVPLGNFATVEPRQRVDVLRRLDGVPVYRLMAVPSARDGEKVVNMGQLTNARLTELHQAMETLEIDPLVNVIFEGQDQDQQESQGFLIKALVVAVFLMSIILVTQLNSFYQMLLVLSAVILSVGGVFLGLLITGQPFGVIMSGVGVISLAGVVVNNNIVLIDTFNHLRRQDIPVVEAVLRTGAQRFRPVMLTTVTTILGLLPMVLQMNIFFFSREISFGSPSTQWWSQMATAVSGGLAFATLLTLVLTPCLLVYPTVFRARRKVRKLKARLKAQPSTGTGAG